MIAEDNLVNSYNPLLSISRTSVILLINQLMLETVHYFKTYLVKGFHKKTDLNEEELTQFYTKQAQILIRIKDYPFNIECEYKDPYNLSKGFSDFFFYPNEQNVSTASIFSVESKRLPSPIKLREKEYVIGLKKNGGIERYKTGLHGNGLNECGLLGFIEKENGKHWMHAINNWIIDLANDNDEWKEDETLSEEQSSSEYHFLKSIAYRKNDSVSLNHLWIVLN